jgi:hypothetical protein
MNVIFSCASAAVMILPAGEHPISAYAANHAGVTQRSGPSQSPTADPSIEHARRTSQVIALSFHTPRSVEAEPKDGDTAS